MGSRAFGIAGMLFALRLFGLILLRDVEMCEDNETRLRGRGRTGCVVEPRKWWETRRLAPVNINIAELYCNDCSCSTDRLDRSVELLLRRQMWNPTRAISLGWS